MSQGGSKLEQLLPLAILFILSGLAAYGTDCNKNAILDGCSTVDSKLDYDGIGWHSMVLHGTRWYFVIE